MTPQNLSLSFLFPMQISFKNQQNSRKFTSKRETFLRRTRYMLKLLNVNNSYDSFIHSFVIRSFIFKISLKVGFTPDFKKDLEILRRNDFPRKIQRIDNNCELLPFELCRTKNCQSMASSLGPNKIIKKITRISPKECTTYLNTILAIAEP